MSSVEPGLHEDGAPQRVAGLGSRREREQAWRQFGEAQTIEEFCGSWLALQCQAIERVAGGVVVLHKPGSTMLAPVAFYPEGRRDPTALAEVTDRALREGRGVILPARNPAATGAEARCQLAHPLRIDGELRGVVGLDLESRPEPQLRGAMRDLQWGSGWLEVLLRRHADPQEAMRLRLRLALDSIAALLEHGSLKESASAFVTELATRLGCDRVSLGLLKGPRARILAVSHSGQIEQRANLLRAVEGAMEEAIDQRAAVMHPPEREGLPVVALSHAQLARESEAGGVLTLPLDSDGETIGALTLERPPGFFFDAASVQICEAVAAVAGPIVELKRRDERSLLARHGDQGRDLWQRLVGPRHALFKLGAAFGAAALLFLIFATGEYRVAADATVEGEVQRAVSAPFNGYVREAHRRAGDTVKRAEIIARLDDRDLRLERVRLAGQREQYGKQVREAMAKHERTRAEIVGAQLEQVAAQLEQIDEQLARVELTAPFDGVIVSGDLSQSLGTPVERGQVLFQVAPLQDFRIILKVDERDFADVEVGQRGELAVASMTDQRFGFTVNKVTAVNVAEEGRNVFRVEARLDEGVSRLRPGMEGVGKVLVDERKLVWIWTHAFTDWLRLWLWSSLP